MSITYIHKWFVRVCVVNIQFTCTVSNSKNPTNREKSWFLEKVKNEKAVRGKSRQKMAHRIFVSDGFSFNMETYSRNDIDR